MRLKRSVLVFLIASLLLAPLAWLLRPSGPQEPKATVHFKLKSGAAMQAMPADGVVSPLFLRSAAALAEDRNEAVALGATNSPDLTSWYRVDQVGDPHALVTKLRARADVVDAFIAPVPSLALLNESDLPARKRGGACPITTPIYDEMQGYLAVAPAGIDAAAAWIHPGGRGGNVAFADVEGGWNDRHEDLPGDRMQHVAGRPFVGRSWVAHGTAVVGMVSSNDNQLGMVGIAPDVSKIVTSSFRDIGVAAAIDEAQARLEPGDVLLIELQAGGPRRRYIPVEYWGDVFDVVKLATDRGVVVVAAAGNGAEDLDHKSYQGRFDRNFRDSGAILVGAGAPLHEGYVARSRLDFSNYGSRVDVQGWGREVASLDYGDLQDCGSPHRRKYTATFAGTSSASPVVSGAALLLQSIYKARHGSVMRPTVLRDLLRQTGSQQTDGPHGSAKDKAIGPLPNLKAALAELP